MIYEICYALLLFSAGLFTGVLLMAWMAVGKRYDEAIEEDLR